MSQLQWQYMARQFGKDRVDYRLTSTSLDATTLPFNGTVVNGTSVSIAPGRALVGGFFYQLTATQTVTIVANTGSLPRTDLIVLRADLSAGSVNLKVVKGQAAASPKVPSLTKSYGGTWEMPLHQVNVPASGGALSVVNVAPFDMAESVAVPWNALSSGALQQVGTFVYDMDNNTNDTQTEYFVGRDGFMAARHLGKSRTYTPNMFNGKYTLPSGNRKGRWRWVAPNVVHVSMSFTAFEDQGLSVSGSNWYLGATLPKAANGQIRQVLSGFIQNPGGNGNLPNAMQVTAHLAANSTNMTLYTPNFSNLAQGLDGVRSLPPASTLFISGTYEANEYNE
jgi:hypothetical protein